MKKSRVVSLGILASVAGAAMEGCGCSPTPAPPPQLQQCVDAQGHVVPDSECDQQGAGAMYGRGGHVMPFWIYHLGRPYRIGETVPNVFSMTSPLQSQPVQRGSAALAGNSSSGGYGVGGAVSGGRSSGGSSGAGESAGIARGGFGGSAAGHGGGGGGE